MKTCQTCRYWGAEKLPSFRVERRRCFTVPTVQPDLTVSNGAVVTVPSGAIAGFMRLIERCP